MAGSRIAGRTLARSQALQLLFQSEAASRSVDAILADDEYLISDGPLDEYAEQLARGAGQELSRIDPLIEEVSSNWSVSRMSSVDRCLLRMAVYEMCAVDEVDPAVTISETVELAKAFGTDESSRFVNGILGNIATRLEAGENVLASCAAE